MATWLKTLLQQQHLQNHDLFLAEYEKVARDLGQTAVGPSRAQFHRWLQGNLKRLPHPHHCRVLEAILPEWTADELFSTDNDSAARRTSPHMSSPVARSNADYGDVDVSQLASAGISRMWPRSSPETFDDLAARISEARHEITVFGLTRNFYARDSALPLFEDKAVQVPVTFYVMHPECSSRQDRYRLEPIEAAMEDPTRYTREILRPLYLTAKQIERTARPSAGLRIYTYNFPCSFAIERIDQSCRVMLYGHGKRGTEGPLMVFDEGTPYWDYFTDQLDWLHRLAAGPREPWTTKGIEVLPLTEADVTPA